MYQDLRMAIIEWGGGGGGGGKVRGWALLWAMYIMGNVVLITWSSFANPSSYVYVKSAYRVCMYILLL